MRVSRFFAFGLLAGLLGTGCWQKLYPPIAYLERTAPIYPEARPEDCNVRILTGPPDEPFETFAQVVSYAGSPEMLEGMQRLIKQNACEAGADAIVLLPVQEGTHYNTDVVYPDWVAGMGETQKGSTERVQHWVDKRYTVSQRAVALVFKRAQAVNPDESGS